MSLFRLRFFKRFRFGPLSFNLSKTGCSLTLKMGPYSRTWGTRGQRTTVDAPGHFGVSFTKQESHKAKHAPAKVNPRHQKPLKLPKR